MIIAPLFSISSKSIKNCFLQDFVPTVTCCSCCKVFSCASADSFPVNVYVRHIIKLNTHMKRASLQQQLEIQNLKSANNFLRESLQTLKTAGCNNKQDTVTNKPTSSKRPADDSPGPYSANLLGLSDITFHTVHSPKSSRSTAQSSTIRRLINH